MPKSELARIVSASGQWTVLGSRGQPTRPSTGRVAIHLMRSLFGKNPPDLEIVSGDQGRWRVTHGRVPRAGDGGGALNLVEDMQFPDFVAARPGKAMGEFVVDTPIVLARESRIVVVNSIVLRTAGEIATSRDYYTHGLDIDLGVLVGPQRADHLLFLDLDSGTMRVHVIPFGASEPDSSQMAYSVEITAGTGRFLSDPFELSFVVVPRTLV